MVFEDISQQQFHVKSKYSVPPVVDRVLAVGFDGVLFAPIFSLLLSQVFKRVQLSLFSNPDSLEYLVLFSVAVILVAGLTVLGQTLSLYYFSTTPGKYFFKIKVLSVFNPETKLTLTQCFLRSVLWVFEFFLLGVPFLEVMSHPLRRALHDRASETMAVSLKQVENSKPNPFEVRFVRSFVLMFSLLMMAWGATVVTRLYKSASQGDFKRADLHTEGYFCEKISKHQKNNSVGSASRIDLAIGLYLVEQVEDHCLLNEAEFGLWTSDPHQKAWGSLAKGIYFNAFDKEKSNKYFHQACAELSDDEACKISQSYLQDKGEMIDGKSVTFRVIKSKSLILASKVSEAIKIFDELAHNSEGFDPYIKKQMVQLLWKQNEYEKSEGAYLAIWPTLSNQDKISISSWMCLEKVQSQCSNQTYSACDQLKKLVFYEKETGVETRSVIALVKEHDCKNSHDPLLPQLTRVLEEEPDLKKLVMAISKESDWSLEHRVAALKELSVKAKKNSVMFVQAQVALENFEKTSRLLEKTRLPASQQRNPQWEPSK